MKLERNLTVGSTCAEGEANLRFVRLWAYTLMARPEHNRRRALIMTTPHHHTHTNLLESTKLSTSILIDVGVLQEVATYMLTNCLPPCPFRLGTKVSNASRISWPAACRYVPGGQLQGQQRRLLRPE